MEINNDADFKICSDCPSLHDCEVYGSCKVKEMITQDVETLTAWINDHKVDRNRGEL